MTAALRFKNLTLGYDRHPAVHHLDGEIAQGALLAVCGPNGGGKSTLLKGIMGVVPPLGGAVERVACPADRIAYLPQAHEIDRTFPVNAFDMVAMGHFSSAGWFRGLSKTEREKTFDAIAAVGLTGFEDRHIGTLSGGQMQRILFARLLLQDAPVILLDEPFNAIDQRTTNELLELVKRWIDEKRTVIAVLHDLDVVRRTFPQTLLLARETIAWGDTASVLKPENLLTARRMVEAFDREAHACERVA
jgi:zinc/manganese transport system ATP-binding protein